MKMTKKLMLSVCAACLVPGLAWAQDTGEGDTANEDGESSETRTVDTFVISARKTEESVVDAPVSATGFNEEQIVRAGITDLYDVATRTPGLNYGNYGDEKLSPVSLRGITGGSSSAGSDPAVGIYLDEVYLGPGVGSSIDLFDLERVEVIRGPQGTLFGRNSVGGVISYTTARPTDYLEMFAEADFGNYDYRRYTGVVSGPLVGDGILGRLSIVSNQRGGFDDNVVRNTDVNSDGSLSVRGQLQFNVDDITTWRLMVDYREVDQDSLVFETLRYNDAAWFPNELDGAGEDRNTNPYDRNVYSEIISHEESEAWGFTSTFERSFNNFDLINITSYREHEYENIADTDRSALDWAFDGDPESVWRFANETRLSGTADEFDWLVGFYYYRQETDNQSFILLGQDLANALGAPSIAGLEAGSSALMETDSMAGFGTVTWNATDRFDVTIGGRYTYEEKQIDYVQSDPVALLGGDFAINAGDSWSQFTPNANVRYRFNDDLMAYVSVSRGFKSGGFNDALGDANGISFDPELLWNYEAGLRTTFLDGRVFAGLTVFYMDWSNIQIAGDNPNTPVFDPIILNGGAAHSTGLEFELYGDVTDNLTVGFNAALLEAEFDDGSLPDGTPLRRVPFTPEYTAAASAEYHAPLANTVDWFVGGEYLLRGESYLTLNNQEDGHVDAYGLVNLRAGLEDEDGRWSVTFWGRNVTDEQAAQRLFDLYDQDLIGQKFVIWNDPATYGVTLRVRY